MRFMSGDPEVPVLARLARNLLIVQAAMFLLGLLLVALIAVMVGSGGTTAASGTTDATVNPGVSIVLTLAGVVVFGLVAYGVGKLDPRARWAAVVIEVLWVAAYVLPHMVSDPGGEVIQVGLAVVVLVLLFRPEVTQAFAVAPEVSLGSAVAASLSAEDPTPSSSEPGAAPLAPPDATDGETLPA